MSNRFLSIFDLSGIQRFIFATNKMKEIVGASAVVHNALFRQLPQALGEAPDAWKQGDVTFTDADEAKIVYVGGGNAMVVFRDENTYRACARELSRKIFLLSGGAIRLTSAAVALEEAEGLAANQKRLMAALDAEKKAGGSAVHAALLPITAYDNNNYEPLILTSDGRATTLSRKAKRAAANTEQVFAEIKPSPDMSFSYDLEDTRREDEKNYQAILHIDGNTMGIRIREYVRGLTGTVWEQLTAMRRLSIAISGLYSDALRETIRETVPSDAEGRLAFRPIVVDGDDITVMLPADRAFGFTETFMQKLAACRIDAFGSGFRPTAAAGIAFVKLKFPFSIAYDLAESCCKNAKAVTIERCGGAAAFLANPVSSMDYQVCYSNISSDLAAYRASSYERDGCRLTRRPYVFAEGDAYSYRAFMDTCEYFNGEMKRGNIARSKLKGLRGAYGVSRLQAEMYGSFILAHEKGGGETEPARRLGEPFGEAGEALFFDYLDIMDVAWKESAQ